MGYADDLSVYVSVEHLLSRHGSGSSVAETTGLSEINAFLSSVSSFHQNWDSTSQNWKTAVEKLRAKGVTITVPPAARPSPPTPGNRPPPPGAVSPIVAAASRPPAPQQQPPAPQQPQSRFVATVKCLYKYDASESDELTLAAGQIVDVLKKDPSGWWTGIVRGGPGTEGKFPHNFTEEIAGPPPPAPQTQTSAQPPPPSGPSPAALAAARIGAAAAAAVSSSPQSQPPPPQQQQQSPKPLQQPTTAAVPPPAPVVAAGGTPKLYARCTNQYTAGEANELSLRPGDVIEVIKQHESGWWKGILNGKTGVFPANFVAVIADESLRGLAAKFRVDGIDTTAAKGETYNFAIRSASFMHSSMLPDHTQFEVIVYAGNSSVASVRGQVNNAGNGLYTVAFIPNDPGENHVVVKLGGEEVPGSGFGITVRNLSSAPIMHSPHHSAASHAAGPPAPAADRPALPARKTTMASPQAAAIAAAAAASPRPVFTASQYSTRAQPQNDGDPRIFGVSLPNAVYKSALEGDCVPAIVRRSIEYIEAKGLQEVGVYRLSGSLAQVNKYKSQWDKGEDVDYLGTCNDPHVVAGLLKQYLREFPERIASELKGDETCLEVLKDELATLPAENYNLLMVLSRHFYLVQSYAQINQMNVNNIAICLCPTMHLKSTTFKALVLQHEYLFS